MTADDFLKGLFVAACGLIAAGVKRLWDSSRLLTELNIRVGALEVSSGKVETDVDAIKSDLADMRVDNAKDVGDLKAQIAELRTLIIDHTKTHA